MAEKKMLPRPVLRLVGIPRGASVSGFDPEGRRVLLPGTRLRLGRAPHLDVVVSGAIIGGRTNLIIETDENARCRLIHAGHAIPIRINGQRMASLQLLADGDIIEPEVVSQEQGLRFVFSVEPPE